MIAGQMTMPATVPGSYWVRVINHGVIPDGTRFLVVRDWHDDWLLCWRDGVRPGHTGTLLKREQTERAEKS